jgi:hypothetical protein
MITYKIRSRAHKATNDLSVPGVARPGRGRTSRLTPGRSTPRPPRARSGAPPPQGCQPESLRLGPAFWLRLPYQQPVPGPRFRPTLCGVLLRSAAARGLRGVANPGDVIFVPSGTVRSAVHGKASNLVHHRVHFLSDSL